MSPSFISTSSPQPRVMRMSDMPDTAFLQEGQRFPDQTVHGRGGGWSNFAFDGATAYIRADLYAELERQRDELVAVQRELIVKAAFVDEMCAAIGVTFEVLVEVNSIKAALAKAEEDDE